MKSMKSGSHKFLASVFDTNGVTKSERGITPIIAIILLLMMTVAAAGASFYWLVKIQGELQGGTSQFQEQTFERMSSSVSWQGGNYNRTTEILTISLLNTGTTEIPFENSSTSPKLQWSLLDNNQDIKCSTDWSGTGTAVKCHSGCGTKIQQSELRLIKINLTGSDCDISTRSNDSLWFAKISFSGKATTAGTFEK